MKLKNILFILLSNAVIFTTQGMDQESPRKKQKCEEYNKIDTITFCQAAARGYLVRNRQAELGERLFDAVKKNNFDAVKESINKGANVNVKDSLNWTPLDSAAWWGYSTICQFLLGHKANIAGSYGQWTPLHSAASNGHLEVCQLLISHGANINAQDNNRWTPLHRAANHHHLNISQLLLVYGADTNLKTERDGTPLELTSNPDIQALLTGLKNWQDLADDNKLTALINPQSQFNPIVKKTIFERFYNTFDLENINKLFTTIKSKTIINNIDKVFAAFYNLTQTEYQKIILINMLQNPPTFIKFLSAWGDTFSEDEIKKFRNYAVSIYGKDYSQNLSRINNSLSMTSTSFQKTLLSNKQRFCDVLIHYKNGDN